MAKRLGQRIKYGELCTCNECKAPLPKTHENFFFRSNGNIQNYVCKPCYNRIEAKRVQDKRDRLKFVSVAKIDQKQALLEKVNTRTFPKGHRMNPTKEQRQALIDKIENRRVYKNENMHQM